MKGSAIFNLNLLPVRLQGRVVGPARNCRSTRHQSDGRLFQTQRIGPIAPDRAAAAGRKKEQQKMKRSISLVLIAILSSSLGCGSKNQTITKAPPGRGSGPAVPPPAPEVVITRLEDSGDRATYLDQLAKDSHFDPQQHVPMLQKYADDADPAVSQKAKQLLDRH
jgi:hypothetical protein